MNLHAPTTSEEEELAIALALSASLSSAAARKSSLPSAPPYPGGTSSANSLLQRPAASSRAAPHDLQPRRAATTITSPQRNRWPSESSSATSPSSALFPLWPAPSQRPIHLTSEPLPGPGRYTNPDRPSRPPAVMQHAPPTQLTAQHSNPPAQYNSTTYPPPSLQQPAQRFSHVGAPSNISPVNRLPLHTLQAIPRSKSAAGPSGLFGSGGAGPSGSTSGIGASSPTSAIAGHPARVPPQHPTPQFQLQQLHSDPDACAGCGRDFGLFCRMWVTGLGRKWHPNCFRCGFCREPISGGSNSSSFSYQLHPSDPLPYHPDCYRHVHSPLCHVCGTYIAASADGVITYRENGFWREKYCTTHGEADLTRCCACSRLQKEGKQWVPLSDGRPLCLQCLSSVVLDTPDAQPLYDEVLMFYAREMRLPHAYKPPLLLVDGPTLNSHAAAEGRDDSAEAPVFHVRGLCVAHVYSHITSMLRGVGGGLRSVVTELMHPLVGSSRRSSSNSRVHCHVKVLLLLFGLPRLLSGSIMAHELMHAWLRMEGVVGLSAKVEEGLCQLMACLWLDGQHELLKGKVEEQRLASFFSYQIRMDISDVYGEGFREAMEAFQKVGLITLIENVKLYGCFMAP